MHTGSARERTNAMYESERGPNPPMGWHERVIFWGVLFPAALLTHVWMGIVLYIRWGWLTR